MKRALTILVVLAVYIGAYAQSPDKMSYQSVVRDASDKLVANSNIGMQISILKGSPAGEAVYVERHFPTTNVNGLVGLEIGTGTIVTGDFSSIQWSIDTYFLKTETDLNGGANYTMSGTSQLLSVPYAFHSSTADKATEFDPYFNASLARTISKEDTAKWNNKLDSFIEADPIFDASVAKAITVEDTTNWNSKLDAYTETDPVFTAAVASEITADDTTNWNNKLDSFTEADPVFSASLASNITQQDTSRWAQDTDPANEIQQLNLTGNSLSLTNGGGTVVLPDSVKGYTYATVAGFTPSTSVDIATVNFTLSEQKTVLILADVNVWGVNACDEVIQLYIDGNAENRTAVNVDNQTAVGGSNGVSASTSWMTSLGAGSHTVKLRGSGGCPIFVNPHLHVIVLGN